MSNVDLLFDPASNSQSQGDLAQLGIRLRDTLDTIREAVFQIDLSRSIQFLNAAWTDITGQCISESIGEPIESFFWEQDQSPVRNLIQRILDGDIQSHAAELRISRRDGTFVWIELRARAICDESGHVIGLGGSILNVNDRRHAEMRLRESETLFRTAFDLSPNGIAIYAGDGRLSQCNRAMAELFGYSIGQLITMDFFVLVQPDDISQARKAIRRAQSGKTTRGVELRCMTRDGRMIWIELAVSLLSDDPGEGALVLLQLQDLSQRKQAETDLQSQNQVLFHAKGMLEAQKMELDQQAEQLQLARQVAEDANRAKTEFLANVSHEIRTPMSTILGFTEVLLDRTQNDQQRSECIDAIRRSGQHLMRIVDDILDVTRIESGRLQLEYSDVQLPMLVDEVICSIRMQAIERNIQLTCEFAGEIPPHVHSDPVRLRQILLNLVSNAVKFTHEGAVKVVVDMSRPNPASGRRYLRLLVSDTGIGMSGAQLQKLFHAFEQGDVSQSRRYGGVGLGLVITRRLVEMLGGTIEVTSREGVGSTFVVTLDVEMTNSGPATPPRRLELPSRADACDEYPSLLGRVLVAEDGKDNQKLLSFLLRRCGIDVVVAENGAEAIQAMKTTVSTCQRFDLILMDMHMPEVDGFAATQAIREAGVTIPIIALTAQAMDGDRDRCLASGCTDYLSKPVDRRSLIKMLGRFLQRNPGAVGPADGSSSLEATILSRFADDPLMEDILRQYVAELPDTVSKLQKALAANDLNRVRSMMHEIRGSAGGYGFDEITSRAGAAEASIRLGADRHYCEASVQEVIKLLRRVDGYNSSQEPAP